MAHGKRFFYIEMNVSKSTLVLETSFLNVPMHHVVEIPCPWRDFIVRGRDKRRGRRPGAVVREARSVPASWFS